MENETDIEIKFEIGSVITLKTHPMFETRRIKGDNRYVPPIMIVIALYPKYKDEILIDIMYDCVYFNDDKSEFVVSILSQSDIRTFEDLKFERINKDGSMVENYMTIIEEVKNHSFPDFEKGKVVSFRTQKLEIYKKRTSKNITIDDKGNIKNIEEILRYVVSFASPNFILCDQKDTYPKEILNRKKNSKYTYSNDLFKVKWFNPIKNKFSEIFLPKECFVNEIKFSA